MKLIIDIDEDIIEGAKSSPNYYPIYHFEKMWRAIINGIPLDNLRAELHATAEFHDDGDCYLRDEWIDEYFDKYKAEGEGME